MSDQSPSWVQSVGALGGVGVVTGFLAWLTGHRLSSAQTRKTEAETDVISENRGAEFEKAVNDRVKTVLDSWREQVSLLSTQIKEQREEIHGLRNEVIALRKALDLARGELHTIGSTSGFGA